MTESEQPLLAGRYRLGRVLGRGGMGEVREAHDLRLGRVVAVKLLPASLAGDPQMRDALESEARIMAQVNHPNVAAIHDVGEDDGTVFLVMECLPGKTFADELREGPTTEARARDVARDVLSALDAAHRRGVIHRDVKPGNVLLDDGGRVKLGDFGIARSVDATQTMASFAGTAHYVAPERLHGQPATVASDLYSVGVVLYEALTGRPPYEGPTPVAILIAIEAGAHAPLEERCPDVDPALRVVVERALRPDALERYSSAAEMAAMIDGATVVAPTAPATEAGGRDTAPATEVRRRDAAPATEVHGRDTAPATNVRRDEAAPATAVFTPAPPSRAAPPSRKTPRRRVRWLALAILVGVLGLGSAAVALVRTGDDGRGPGPSSTPSPPSTVADSALPTELRLALEKLAQAVRP